MRSLLPLFLLFFQHLNAQQFAWMRPLPDNPNALAVDVHGNVLVRTIQDISFSQLSHQLRLLNPAGETLWAKELPKGVSFNGPVKTDAQGNFYFPLRGTGWVNVAGIDHIFAPDKPEALAKLGAAGIIEWIRYDAAYIFDFDFDEQGNVYTAGKSMLRKWDQAGAPLWEIPTPSYVSTGFPAGNAYDLEVVTNDRIVVAGTLSYVFGQDIQLADTTLHFNDQEAVFLVAFDQNGQRKWLKTGSTYAATFGRGGLAHDQQGMVYMGFNPFSLDWEGWQLPPGGSALGPALFKIAADDGQQAWAKNYPEWSWLNGLAVSPDGAIFLAGELRNLDDPDGEIVINGTAYPRQLNYQAYAARFSTDGVPQWLAVSNDADGAAFDHIAYGPQGNLWVSGYRGWSSFGITRYGSERLFLGANGYGVVGVIIDTLAVKPAPAIAVQGTVFDDAAPDCQLDITEPGLVGLTLLAEPGPFLAKTDASGRFTLSLPPGDYTVRPVEQLDHAQQLGASCVPVHVLQLPQGSPGTAGVDFPLAVERCAALAAGFEVDHDIVCYGDWPGAGVDSFLNIRIVYGNFGAAALAQTDLYIDFPSEFYPVSSTPIAWTTFNTLDSSLLFSFSDLQPGSLDTLDILLALNCDQVFSGFQPPVHFPFAAYLEGQATSCYPEDSVLTSLSWDVHYFIPVGVHDPASSFRFSVAPNPSADGVFRIKMAGDKVVHWEISDALGRPVYRFASSEQQLQVDLQAAAPGVYFLHGQSAGSTDTVRLVRH